MKFILFVSLPLYVIDQWTKQFVLRSINPYEARIIAPDFFSLVNVTNTGAAFGSFKGNNLLFIVISVVALVVGIIVWAGTSGGRNRIDEFKLRAPIIGHLWTMFSMAQLSRTLSTLLQGGIPLTYH